MTVARCVSSVKYLANENILIRLWEQFRLIRLEQFRCEANGVSASFATVHFPLFPIVSMATKAEKVKFINIIHFM